MNNDFKYYELIKDNGLGLIDKNIVSYLFNNISEK